MARQWLTPIPIVPTTAIDDKIARDQQLGKDSGVSGTPTWFINGESVNGTVDAISSKIDELLGE